MPTPQEKWKAKWDCGPCLKFVNYALDDDVLAAWGYSKWAGPGNAALAARLNGALSWMQTPKEGEGSGSGSGSGNGGGGGAKRRKASKPTYVSAATLKRQQAQAQGRGAAAAAHGGHAPPHRPAPGSGGSGGENGGENGGGSGLSPLGGGWKVAGGRNEAFGEPPAHVASGGPMDVAKKGFGLSIAD